jgi:TDG/mug DNA glycosylase family protein
MPVLPDLLAPGLVTVFCGSAVGAASARIGAPYAGPGNKFRPTLAETGPTPRRFAPQGWRKLAALGVDLALLNTVRTTSFDQVLALKPWLPAIPAAA